jgi:hypothetical protein
VPSPQIGHRVPGRGSWLPVRFLRFLRPAFFAIEICFVRFITGIKSCVVNVQGIQKSFFDIAGYLIRPVSGLIQRDGFSHRVQHDPAVVALFEMAFDLTADLFAGFVVDVCR